VSSQHRNLLAIYRDISKADAPTSAPARYLDPWNLFKAEGRSAFKFDADKPTRVFLLPLNATHHS
jgi:hypothetical protein